MTGGTRRPSAAVWVTAIALVAALGGIALLAGGGARSSVLSRDPEGWAGVRRYLAARGTEVALLDRPLEESAPGRGTLVVAFPWQRGAWESSLAADVGRHLTAGGHLLIAYSGSAGALEELALSELGLESEPARPEPPLGPRAWRRHVTEVWHLAPEESLAGVVRPLAVPALDRVPAAPPATRALFRSPQGRPVVFSYPSHGGLVVVVPAPALANARLALPGNADLLESLTRSLPAPWSFDELHHGLVAAGSTAASDTHARVLDLVLVQLLVLYALAAVALGRRFGPPWREAPVVTGSTGAFFLGLGTLHHRLGHHAEAAHRLIDRSRELDRHLNLPDAVERRAAAGVDASGLVEIARDVATRRHAP